MSGARRLSRARRLSVLLAGSALVASMGLVASSSAVAAETTTVTLVGDLQSEVGCSEDWQPSCESSRLARVGDTSTYRATFTVPAGSWQFKVAINASWDVNYGAGGELNGGNIPLVLLEP